MNESIAQANGRAPVEQLVAVEDMLRPMVAHEVGRQLAGGSKSRTFELLLREVAWAAALITVGYVLAGWLS
jgi:hypothetical protein